MTKEALLKIAGEAFEKGQVAGIELACDLLSKSIIEFKEKIVNEYKQRNPE